MPCLASTTLGSSVGTAGEKTVTLGPEYDDSTRDALKRVLLSLSAMSANASWGVGGSQEFESLKVFVAGSPLVIESETYIGLTIAGEEALVDRVAGLVRAQLGQS